MICITTAQTILPVLAFGVSILASVVSFKAYRFSQRTHIANRRPYVIFIEKVIKENPGGGAEETGFYLQNIGLGPAVNIEIPKAQQEKHSFLNKWGEIPRNLSPNGFTLVNIAPDDQRFIDSKLILEAYYFDYNRKEYKSELKVLKHHFYYKDKGKWKEG